MNKEAKKLVDGAIESLTTEVDDLLTERARRGVEPDAALVEVGVRHYASQRAVKALREVEAFADLDEVLVYAYRDTRAAYSRDPLSDTASKALIRAAADFADAVLAEDTFDEDLSTCSERYDDYAGRPVWCGRGRGHDGEHGQPTDPPSEASEKSTIESYRSSGTF